MVVHELAFGARVACAVIGLETGAGSPKYVTSFGKYPGYNGNLEVAGQLTLVGTSGTGSTAKQTLTWSLTGLDTACTASPTGTVANSCGIHIHTGTSCDVADQVGGHYWNKDAIAEDPWAPITYEASSAG